MPVSQFFCCAVEGATTDGREISRQWINDIAETYSPRTYEAQANLEHIKGVDPNGLFKMYGKILAFKTGEIEVDIGGKPVKKLALYAKIDASQELIDWQKKGQKKFCSLEVNPNFLKTGKAYCQAFGFTDTPASIGTEVLTFASKASVNPFASRKLEVDNLFSEAIEVDIKLEDISNNDASAQSQADNFFSALMSKIESLTAPKPAPKVEPPANLNQASNSPDFAALVETFKTGFEGVANQFANLNAKLDAATLAAKTANDDLASLKSELDNTQSSNFKARNPSTGGASTLPRF